MSLWKHLFGPRSARPAKNATSPFAQPATPKNEDVLTVIEADGLFADLPTGLFGWEEVRLSACFLGYARERNAANFLDYDAVRREAKRKYAAQDEGTRIVVQALTILLNQAKMNDADKKIVTKVVATLSGSPASSSKGEADLTGQKGPASPPPTVVEPPRISAVMEQFRLSPGEQTAQTACDELAAIGTDDILPALAEVFRKGEKVHTDQNGSLPFQSSLTTPPGGFDYADIPVRTLIGMKTPFSVLKNYFSDREYEEILFRCWKYTEWNSPSNRNLLDALTDLGSLKVARFMQNSLLKDREGKLEETLIGALSKFGANHLKDLMGNFRLPIIEPQITRYQNNILKILSTCGDASCVEAILKVARDGSTVANQARSTLRDIAARDPSVALPEFCLRPAPIVDRPTIGR